MKHTSLYWHDYETWGANPSVDRPAQFAGVRTDEDLNIIGEPLVAYCKPANDMLPDPMACLVTGITPQKALQHGLNEAEFIAKVHRELSLAGTCGVGYNTIRFDDEVTRYTLYRNFYDPYEREWRNGNSRWDIIDMVRLTRALRPDGIEWPIHTTGEYSGRPSFRLEQITAANGIDHASAHDALSDVYATIAVARMIKEKQPKLYDYVFAIRNKRSVAAMLDVVKKKPVIHVSSMFSTDHMCLALVMPLALHPTNTNGVICYDLSVNPEPLIQLSAEEVSTRLYTAKADLPEGVDRIPLKTIHINKCPVVATPKLLDDAAADRLRIDLALCNKHYQMLLNAVGMTDKLHVVFGGREFEPITDPDRMLYSGGFFSEADRQAMSTVRKTSPDQLASLQPDFNDERLTEMLFRYRARNYPETLNEAEQARWNDFRRQRLTDNTIAPGLTIDTFREEIAIHMRDDEHVTDGQQIEKRALLSALSDYADELL